MPTERRSSTTSALPALPETKTEAVRAAILDWYRRGHRDLPWRQTHDPYAILVSEIMLQQTQVDRVLPKYAQFLELYPTVAALAAAPRADVIRNWAPLGYNLRAVRLHEIARQAMERYDGTLPGKVEELLTLNGVGPYTAAAVACFAFGQPVAAMDTNVRRVLGRIFAADAPAALEDDRAAWALAKAVVPDSGPDAYDWNQALMDLGATLCTSRQPRCLLCPAQEQCSARAEWLAPPFPPFVQAAEHLPAGDAVGRFAVNRLVAERRAGYGPDSQPTARAAGGRSKRGGAQPEERFEGSRRWYRGRIIDALRALPAGGSLSLHDLGPTVKADYSAADLPWLQELVTALCRDGLASTVTQPGETPRVALPT